MKVQINLLVQKNRIQDHADMTINQWCFQITDSCIN